jgi:3-methylcrotonyl-CoA carboxylase beta subunit
VSAEELGGAELHCRTSGVCDYYAENDMHALEMARRIIFEDVMMNTGTNVRS